MKFFDIQLPGIRWTGLYRVQPVTVGVLCTDRVPGCFDVRCSSCGIALEQRPYAPSTINPRLAAIRQLAYEASDCGLLSPDLVAGIRRVKGVRWLGVRVGDWLTADEGKKLLCTETTSTLLGRRNRALLSLLIGCGLRRAEVTALRFEDLQLREGHWVIADLPGKGGHIRTIRVPQWVKEAVDSWTADAGITFGPLLRSINKAGKIWDHGFTPKVIWAIVKANAKSRGLPSVGTARF